MKSQEEIELEMRICALEYVLSKLVVSVLSSTVPPSEMERNLDEFARAAAASHETFPELDPVQSDMASDEWRMAIGRLVNMQKEMLAAVVPLKKPPETF